MSHSNDFLLDDVLDHLRPTLDELEEVRLKLITLKLKARRGIAVAGVAWFLVMILFASQGNGVFAFVLCLIGFGATAWVVHLAIMGKRVAEYRLLFKERIFTQVTKLVQPDMNYTPSRGISKSLFQSSG